MAKNYIYTDLSAKDAVTLTIDGRDYKVTQFSSSWAVNEIPTAVCMLAIGRDARSLELSAVHKGGRPKQITKAKVTFKPTGEYGIASRGLLGRHITKWPEAPQTIFDGYFTGFAFRKINGKVSVVVSLVHWTAALGFSSCLTKAGHVSNPSALNAVAVMASLNDPKAGQGSYISSLPVAQICADRIGGDLWSGIKSVFCKLAAVPTMPVGTEFDCLGAGDFGANDFALNALSRIEGPSGNDNAGSGVAAVTGIAATSGGCSMPYKHGVPLEVSTLGIEEVVTSISLAIGEEAIASYGSTTFWDKLVNQFCPMFGMAVVPMVSSAIVIADTPAYSGGVWRKINPIDYDSFDMTAELHRPLRAVGIVVDWVSPLKAGMENNNGGSEDVVPLLGGCYVENSVEPGDGMVLYVSPPSWLSKLADPSIIVTNTSGTDQVPIKTATTPAAETGPPKDVSTLGVNANKLYERYAKMVYASQSLRGRGGSASGKLRFDIAPGSIVHIDASFEPFIGAEDDLAMPQIACVQRVGIAINAEAGLAGTTFVLSHVRGVDENESPRTSVKEHPLFGKAIHGGGLHGSPLVDAYDIR